jgi:RHS repeat-associated protein
MVFDPMDFVPLLGATILVNGVPRAQAGTGAKDIPVHFPLGGTFIKPPGNEGEMYMGSTTVLAEGEPFTFMSLPVLSCHDIGMPPPPRPKNTDGSKTMMLPTSLVLPIPMGRPVLVGGLPTISLTDIAMKIGLAGLGKGLKKFRKWQKGSDRMAALSKKLKKAVDKLPLSPGARNRLKRLICTLTGHPVNVADGSVLTSTVDFELPGPIPFKWERHWFSGSTYQGPLGHGWFHPYDLALQVQSAEGIVVARLEEGRLAAFPLPEAGSSYFDRTERLTLCHDGTSLFLRDQNLLTYRFQKDGVGEEGLKTFYLESIEDPNRFRIQFAYSTTNVLSRIIDSAGRELRFTNDEQGRISQIEALHPDQPGAYFVLQSYRYDDLGNLVEAKDALGHPMLYAYEGHLLVQETNRNKLNFYFQYQGKDENAKCYRTWGDGGIYDHKLSYLDGYTVVENALGYLTAYYHEGGLVHKTIDPDGEVLLTVYNEHNELISEKDPSGFGPVCSYDDMGNEILRLEADGATTQSTYNALNLPTKVIDAVGGVWQWQYDDKGNLVERTDSLGHTTKYIYKEGRLAEIINPGGGKTLLGYDNQHNLKVLVAPDGQSSWWHYDALGRCIEAIDSKGNAQRRVYDLLGRLVEMREPDGNTQQLFYDGEGNVIRSKDQHHDIQFEYCGMNRLKARTVNGTRMRFRYDAEEQLIGIVNEHGNAYQFTLNAFGEVIEERRFDGIHLVYTRDAVGRITEVQRPDGFVTQYRHDPAGRVINIRHADGTEESFAYREDGELMEASNSDATVRFDRDLLGRIIREHQGGITVESSFDAFGMRNSVRSSLGTRFKFLRNAIGDISQVSAGDWQVHFRRDPSGMELERQFAGGLRCQWSRDHLGRSIKQEIYTGHGYVQRTRSYKWGVNDRLHQMIDSQLGQIHFGHDGAGYLAWSENPDGSVLYRMPDAVGNLFRSKDRTDRTYGSGGQLIQSGSTRYEYSPEGNLVRKTNRDGAAWRYEWNAAGRLNRVVRPDGEAVTFTYDALGRRLSKTFRGQTTRWVWDGDTPLHQWVEKSGSIWDVRRIAKQAGPDARHLTNEGLVTWLFEPESFAPLAKFTQQQAYGIVTDHLGTPISMHDAASEIVWSADLNSYGEVTNLYGGAEACPFRFPGQYEDAETGLYYNRFRYYDPAIGSYISQDPIGLEGGFNLQAYVEDPLEWIDPLGLGKFSPKTRRSILDDNVAFWGRPTCEACTKRVVRPKKSMSGVRRRHIMSEWQLDHIIPDSKGGRSTLGNGQILCRRCNREKSNNSRKNLKRNRRKNGCKKPVEI